MKLTLEGYKIRKSGKGAVLTIPSVALNLMKLSVEDSVVISVNESAMTVSKAVKLDPIFAGIVAPMRGKE